MRFIRGYALVHVFITSRSVLGKSAYSSCACQRSPSMGWSMRRIFLPYSLHPSSGASSICPLIFLIRCIPNTLAFQKKTWGIRSILEVSPFNFFCPALSREAPELPVIFLTASTRAGSSVPSNLLGVIQSCCRVANHWNARLVALFWDIDRPKGSLFSRRVSALFRNSCLPVS